MSDDDPIHKVYNPERHQYMFWILDEQDVPQPMDDLKTWIVWMATHEEQCLVADDHDVHFGGNPKDLVRVATHFVGTVGTTFTFSDDKARTVRPFETMFFRGDDAFGKHLWATRAEALAGHKRLRELVIRGTL